MAKRAYVTAHRTSYGSIVAVCDEELLGREIVDGDLKLVVSRDFYGGALVSVDELPRYVREATMANILGNNSVKALTKVYPSIMEAAIRLGGVLHVQVFNSKEW